MQYLCRSLTECCWAVETISESMGSGFLLQVDELEPTQVSSLEAEDGGCPSCFSEVPDEDVMELFCAASHGEWPWDCNEPQLIPLSPTEADATVALFNLAVFANLSKLQFCKDFESNFRPDKRRLSSVSTVMNSKRNCEKVLTWWTYLNLTFQMTLRHLNALDWPGNETEDDLDHVHLASNCVCHDSLFFLAAYKSALKWKGGQLRGLRVNSDYRPEGDRIPLNVLVDLVIRDGCDCPSFSAAGIVESISSVFSCCNINIVQLNRVGIWNDQCSCNTPICGHPVS